MKRKYGIWILPIGEEKQKLQSLINSIADEYTAPKFIPHISIAGMLCEDSQLDTMKARVDQLAKKINAFTISLGEYGTMEERHRCIYMLAKSNMLTELFDETTIILPEAVKIERNRAMPHMSIVYGEYPQEIKREIISKHLFNTITMEANGLDLCLSEGPEEKWHSVYHAGFNLA
ncbi:MAG: 2'-5' RNA ligase family protein [Patescibacteria group bacterium]|nr:2'-5' RNA ligase family protein [Patescibacteria group bacterium]